MDSRLEHLLENHRPANNCRNIVWIFDSTLGKPDEGLSSLKKALKKKPCSANALLDLARRFEHGDGVAHNEAEAKLLHEKALLASQ